MRTLPADEPFTRAAANRIGVSDSALSRAVPDGALIRVRRGVYADPAVPPDFRRDVVAASLAYPGLPLSHISGAVMLGVPVVGAHPQEPEMTVEPRGAGNVRGVHAYRARVREHDVVEVQGRLCLSPARTVIDIARHYPPLTSVPAIDHVLHAGLASPDELRDVLDFCRRWPGAPKARRAVRASDSRSESPLESVSRLVIPTLGLPAPEPQVQILDESGRVIARADFYWDEFGVIGEADGAGKYLDGPVAVVVAEKDRENTLRDTGLAVARWNWPHAWSDRAELRRRLVRARERGRMRERDGTPRLWTPVSTGRLVVL